jgi:hypothetical protein
MAEPLKAPVADVEAAGGWLWTTRAAATASVLGLWLLIAVPLWQEDRFAMVFLLVLGVPVWGAYLWVLYRLRRSSLEKGAKDARVVGAVALALSFLPFVFSVVNPEQGSLAVRVSLAFFFLTQVALVVSAWKVCGRLPVPSQPPVTGDPRWIRATLLGVSTCLLVVVGMVVFLTVRLYASEGGFALTALLLLVPFGAPYAWSAWCLARQGRQEQGLSASIGVGLFMLVMCAVFAFILLHDRSGLGMVAPVAGFGLLQFFLVAMAAKSRHMMRPADLERRQVARYLMYAAIALSVLLVSLVLTVVRG